MNNTRNINFTRPDTADNVPRFRDVSPATDYRGIAVLIGVLILGIILLFITLYGIFGLDCWINSEIQCNAQIAMKNILIWGLGLTLALAIIGGFGLISQTVLNSAYLSMRGIIVHRKDLRQYAANIIEVARVSAKSEATAGIDTYSPSISNSSTIKDDKANNNNAGNYVDNDNINIPAIAIEDL